MTQPTVTINTVAAWVKDLKATAGSCEKARHLSTSTAGERVFAVARGVKPPILTHQTFGCEFQPTHLGNVKRNEIRLRQHGPPWDVQSRR
ncbi:MAG: hypothetical protein J07HQX50_00616 [Haloquadratum sp. J07HQX50]|jgi:hypothetical protein|nr:MAG: hypothetical protein J07HQX50_00616 [Haloquadratum sp. J07HQX50]